MDLVSCTFSPQGNTWAMFFPIEHLVSCDVKRNRLEGEIHEIRGEKNIAVSVQVKLYQVSKVYSLR